MTSGEHTKGRVRQFSFEQDESSSGPMFTVFNEHGLRVTDPYISEVDANLIVTAVNTYPAVAELVESLMHCQSALAMVISPHAIQTSSVQNAFAQATEAECKARSALTRFREAQAGRAA